MQPSKWDLGAQCIQKGCDYQESGNSAQAAKLFERGIQHMLNHIKSMPPSTRKHEKQVQVDNYLDLLAGLRPDKNQFAANNTNHTSHNHNTRSNAYKRSSSIPSSQPSAKVSFKKRKTKPQPRPQPMVRSFGNKQDKALYERIETEIISSNPNVSFEDVIGLENVKQALLEAVILPAQRPDIFVGVRAPPRGLLLFGPPGNGKTFIAKALATECKATFFCISSSTLTSRYVGDGEKLVRAMFACARDRAPSIIFIDEIDSILTARGGKDEQESSRRMKTEFLIQFDGVQSDAEQRVLLVGATNLPWELDDAALRRFPKKILVDRPDSGQRRGLVNKLLFQDEKLKVHMDKRDVREVVSGTDGYSASDMNNLVNDAAMGPVRELGMDVLLDKKKDVPPVRMEHFREALQNVKPSTSLQSYEQFAKWNAQYGTRLKVHKKASSSKSKKEPSSWLSSMF